MFLDHVHMPFGSMNRLLEMALGSYKRQVRPLNIIVLENGAEKSVMCWVLDAGMEEHKLLCSLGDLIGISSGSCGITCDDICGGHCRWHWIDAVMEWYHVKVALWVSGSGEYLLAILCYSGSNGSKVDLAAVCTKFWHRDKEEVDFIKLVRSTCIVG